ncbi:MAG: hypothetical protein PHC34_06310 [Candidatus Gastranaerophilales bacterium]|nr:hypothetical protein [Candidatus Gastranaerophilales bacterium]
MKVASNPNTVSFYENKIKRQAGMQKENVTFSSKNQQDNVSFSGDIEQDAVKKAVPFLKRNKKNIIKGIALAATLLVGITLGKSGAVDPVLKQLGITGKQIAGDTQKTVKELSSQVDKVIETNASLKFDQNYNADGNLAPIFIPKEDRDYYSKVRQALFVTDTSDKAIGKAGEILKDRGYKVIELTKEHLAIFKYINGEKAAASIEKNTIKFNLSEVEKNTAAYVDNKGNYAFLVASKAPEGKYNNVINFVMHNAINDHIKNVISVIRKDQSPTLLGKLDNFISNKIIMLQEETGSAKTDELAAIVTTQTKLNQAKNLIVDINNDQSTLKAKMDEMKNLLYPVLDEDSKRLLGKLDVKKPAPVQPAPVQQAPVQQAASNNQQIVNTTGQKPVENVKPVEVPKIVEVPKSVKIILSDEARNANINAEALTNLSVARYTNLNESLKFDRNYNELPQIAQVIKSNNRDYYTKILKVDFNEGTDVNKINNALSGMNYSQIKTEGNQIAYKDPKGNFAFVKDKELTFIPHAHLDANIRFLNYQMRQNIEYAPDKLTDMKEFLDARLLLQTDDKAKTAIINAKEAIGRINNKESQQTEMTKMKTELYGALTAE